jgi:hypothetical protein
MPTAPATRTCPYCAEAVKPEAVVCPHCRKDIGPGHRMKDTGQKLQAIGCGLTLLVTVPIILVLFLARSC